MPEEKTYLIGTEVFDVPDNEAEAFLKENPKAIEAQSYTIGKDTFDVPIYDVEAFLKENPKAKTLKKKVSGKGLFGGFPELQDALNIKRKDKKNPNWLEKNTVVTTNKEPFSIEQGIKNATQAQTVEQIESAVRKKLAPTTPPELLEVEVQKFIKENTGQQENKSRKVKFTDIGLKPDDFFTLSQKAIFDKPYINQEEVTEYSAEIPSLNAFEESSLTPKLTRSILKLLKENPEYRLDIQKDVDKKGNKLSASDQEKYIRLATFETPENKAAQETINNIQNSPFYDDVKRYFKGAKELNEQQRLFNLKHPDFEAAKAQFEETLAQNPNDETALAYLEEIEQNPDYIALQEAAMGLTESVEQHLLSDGQNRIEEAIKEYALAANQIFETQDEYQNALNSSKAIREKRELKSYKKALTEGKILNDPMLNPFGMRGDDTYSKSIQDFSNSTIDVIDGISRVTAEAYKSISEALLGAEGARKDRLFRGADVFSSWVGDNLDELKFENEPAGDVLNEDGTVNVENIVRGIAGATPHFLAIAAGNQLAAAKIGKALGIGAKGANTIATVGGIYATSFAQYSDLADEMGITGRKKAAFTHGMALNEGLWESILPNNKVFTRSIRKQLVKDFAENIVKGGNKKALKEAIKNAGRVVARAGFDGSLEAIEEVGVNYTNPYLNKIVNSLGNKGQDLSTEAPTLNENLNAIVPAFFLSGIPSAISSASSLTLKQSQLMQIAASDIDATLELIEKSGFSKEQKKNLAVVLETYNVLNEQMPDVGNGKKAYVIPRITKIEELKERSQDPDRNEALVKADEQEINTLQKEVNDALSMSNKDFKGIYDREISESLEQKESESIDNKEDTTLDDTTENVEEKIVNYENIEFKGSQQSSSDNSIDFEYNLMKSQGFGLSSTGYSHFDMGNGISGIIRIKDHDANSDYIENDLENEEIGAYINVVSIGKADTNFSGYTSEKQSNEELTELFKKYGKPIITIRTKDGDTVKDIADKIQKEKSVIISESTKTGDKVVIDTSEKDTGPDLNENIEVDEGKTIDKPAPIKESEAGPVPPAQNNEKTGIKENETKSEPLQTKEKAHLPTITPEETEKLNKEADNLGFGNIFKATNSVNKRLGTNYKDFRDIPKEDLQKVSKERKEGELVDQKSGEIIPKTNTTKKEASVSKENQEVYGTLKEANKIVVDEDGNIKEVKQNSGFPSQLYEDIKAIIGSDKSSLNEYLNIKNDNGKFKEEFGDWENRIMKDFGNSGKEYTIVRKDIDDNKFIDVREYEKGKIVMAFNNEKLARNRDFNKTKEEFSETISNSETKELFNSTVNKLRDLKLHLIHMNLGVEEITSLNEIKRINDVNLAKDYFGEPMIFMHAGAEGIESFKKPDDVGYKQNDNITGSAGIYFSRDVNQAGKYAKIEEGKPAKGKDIYYVFLKIKNPYYITDPFAQAQYKLTDSKTLTKDDENSLKELGYDSIIWDEEEAPKHEVVVFDPNQVAIFENFNSEDLQKVSEQRLVEKKEATEQVIDVFEEIRAENEPSKKPTPKRKKKTQTTINKNVKKDAKKKFVSDGKVKQKEFDNWRNETISKVDEAIKTVIEINFEKEGEGYGSVGEYAKEDNSILSNEDVVRVLKEKGFEIKKSEKEVDIITIKTPNGEYNVPIESLPEFRKSLGKLTKEYGKGKTEGIQKGARKDASEDFYQPESKEEAKAELEIAQQVLDNAGNNKKLSAIAQKQVDFYKNYYENYEKVAAKNTNDNLTKEFNTRLFHNKEITDFYNNNKEELKTYFDIYSERDVFEISEQFSETAPKSIEDFGYMYLADKFIRNKNKSISELKSEIEKSLVEAKKGIEKYERADKKGYRKQSTSFDINKLQEGLDDIDKQKDRLDILNKGAKEIKRYVEINKPSLSQRIIDGLESVKIRTDKKALGIIPPFNIVPAVWNTSITIIQNGIRAGKVIKDAIEDGVAYIKANVKGVDEKKLRDFFYEKANVKDTEPTEEVIEPKPEKKAAEEPKEDRVSGIKKALVSDDKVEATDIEKRSTEQMLEAGKNAVESGDVKPAIIVSAILKEPRALQAIEVAALVYYKTQLDNVYDTLAEDIEEYRKDNDTDKLVLAQEELHVLEKAIDDYHEMSLLTAYEQSLAFRLRQMLLSSEYNLQSQIRKYKLINNGVIPPDILEKFEQYDKELKSVQQELKELREKQEIEEGQDAIDNIKESVDRQYKKPKQKSVLTEKEQKRKRELSKKLFGRFNDITSFAQLIADKEFYEFSGLVIKETKGDFNRFAKQITGAVGNAVRKFLPDLYRDLGGKGETIFDNTKVAIKNGKLIIPNAIIRDLVAGGVDTIETLTDAIYNDIKDEFPNITKRNIRDTITNYGRTINLSKEEIDVKIRGIKRIGKLFSALEDVLNKKRPLRSGLQRDKLNAEERRLKKAISEGLKDIPLSEEEVNEAWATALDKVKSRLRNQIEDLQNQIETGEKTPKKKGIEYDNEAKLLQAERDGLKQTLEQTEGKPSISDEQRLRMAMNSVERGIEDLERRIAENDFSIGAKRPPISSEELTALKERRASLRDVFKKMETEAGIVEKKRIEIRKRNIDKKIAEYQSRIKNKDYTQKKRAKPPIDKEITAKEVELLLVKEKFDVESEKIKRKNRSLREKVFEISADIWNMTKSLVTTLDLSAPLRQGAVIGYANPKIAIASMVEMFKQMVSQKAADSFLAEMRTKEEYSLMRKSKLYLAEPSSKLSAKEEAFMSNLVHKIPLFGKLVKGSERAYTGYLNKMRVDAFVKFSEQLKRDGYDENKDLAAFTAAASFVNNATGRGNLLGMEGSAVALSFFIFSPRYVASRIALLNPYKYYKMPPPLRKEALKSMAIFTGSWYLFNNLLILAIQSFFDDEEVTVEEDPRSSDFGKVRAGDLRFDNAAGMQQPIRVMSQIVTGQTKSSHTGNITELNSGGYFSRTRGDVLFSFGRSKLSPSFSFVVNWLDGENIVGEPFEITNEMASLVTPLYLSDAKEILEEEGVGLASIGIGLSAFGVGIQRYSAYDGVGEDGLGTKTEEDLKLRRLLRQKQVSVTKKKEGSIKIKGEDMTEEQFKTFSTVRGGIIKDYLLDNYDKLMQLSPEDVQKRIKRVKASATRRAKIKANNPISKKEFQQLPSRLKQFMN